MAHSVVMNTSVPPPSHGLRNTLFALVILGLGIGAWWLTHHAHESPDHHHHDAAATALTLNDGQRWKTDQPLRTGMQRIRDAVDQATGAHVNARFTAEDATALSATVQENVNYLIANCKLAPKADAALHVVITDLLTAATRLAGNPAAHEGWEQLHRALRQYPDFFEHPGWVGIDPPKH